MTDSEPPKITFPCEDYPIKIMGLAGQAFLEEALNVIQQHAPDFDRSNYKIQGSSKGRFQSITVFIRATGVDQLQAIFEDLKKNPATRMVL